MKYDWISRDYPPHRENCDQRPLQKTYDHVAPVVFVVRHTCVSHINGKGHQEELNCGSEEAGPLGCHTCLDIQLHGTRKNNDGLHNILKEDMGRKMENQSCAFSRNESHCNSLKVTGKAPCLNKTWQHLNYRHVWTWVKQPKSFKCLLIHSHPNLL